MDKILFIAYHYPPDGSAGAQRVVKFVRHLSVTEAHVLTVKDKHFSKNLRQVNDVRLPVNGETIYRAGFFDCFGWIFKLKNLFKSKKTAMLSEDANIVNIAKVKQANPGFCKTLKETISCLIKFPDFGNAWFLPAVIKGYLILKRNNINIIFATGMPWTSLLVGTILKILTRKKLVLDFRDPWVNNPYISKNTRLEKWMDKKCEAFVVNKANLILANTDTLKNDMETRYGDIKHKIMHLPNGYDSSDYLDIPDILIPKKRFIITHTGFLYLKRDPISLFNAIAILKQRYPLVASKILCYLIGPVTLDYNLKETCVKKGIAKNVEFLGTMGHKKCMGYLYKSDLLLIIQPGTKSQIPSKLYEYIFFEKPILAITEKDSALELLISDYGFGHVFEPDDCQGIAEYLYALYKQNKPKEIKSEFGIFYKNKELFNVENIIDRLEKRLSEL